jgi:hypothetical protein
MRNSLLAAAAAGAGLLYGNTASASAWTPPTNVRVVQQTNAPTTNVYTTIQAAFASIPMTGTAAPSAGNPFVVRVMPGVYDLGTGSLQMKPYVDVEGSGPDNTIITSSNANVDGGTCTVGTVLMANNTSIRNIKIVNRAPALNGAYVTVAALVFNNAKAKAEGISVLTGSNAAEGGQNDGICTFGVFADATLNNVTVETYNTGTSGQSNAIITMGGRLTLTNSKLTSHASQDVWCNVINDNSDWQTPSTLTIVNSTVEGVCPNGDAVFAGINTVSISNSTLVLNVSAGGTAMPFNYGGALSMVNSRILVSGGTAYYYFVDPATVKIANSQLPGDLSGLAGGKLVNMYDENFNPIPNQ